MMQRASERQDLERDSLEVSLMVRLVNLFAIVVPMGVHHAADSRCGGRNQVTLAPDETTHSSSSC